MVVEYCATYNNKIKSASVILGLFFINISRKVQIQVKHAFFPTHRTAIKLAESCWAITKRLSTPQHKAVFVRLHFDPVQSEQPSIQL